jgi:secretion/DNA translocation related CpaE-like protein
VPNRRCRVIAVTGARGGAGATSLAAALAVTGARGGRQVLLIDADPLGGGIDLALGLEDRSGPRWPALAATAPGPAPLGGLPAMRPGGRGRLVVLSHDRDRPVRPETAELTTLLDEAGRTTDLVVVDLPRWPGSGLSAVAERADLALLIVPAEVRACAAAAAQARALGGCPDVRLVVRGPAPGGLDAASAAAAIGLPLAGWLRPEPGLAAALERGEPPGSRRRGPLASLCRELLDEQLPGGP